MKSKLASLLALTASASVANASILIQELFDDISTASNGATLNGAGNTATTIGLTGNWATNFNTSIWTANNFDVRGSTLPGLPPDNGAKGGVWRNGANNWNTAIYATRPLAGTIDFAENRVIYFSVRLNNPGDTGMGVGLASGSGATDEFVGAGFSWNNASPIGSTALTAGNSAYISHGTLGTTERGVYGIRAFEGLNTVNGFGLLVGRITINASGSDVIQIKRYAPNTTIDDNLNTIAWSATSEFDTAMIASRLVLWDNGSGLGELDAIRFGESWEDVTGVALVGTEQLSLSGAGASEISTTSASADVNLLGSAADVTLHWSNTDHDLGPWANSISLGSQAVGQVNSSISGLSPDTLYFYRFHAGNPVAEPDLEAWSEEGRSFATALTGLAVTNLQATPAAYKVDLSWTDNFNTETGFIIQRSPAGAGEWLTVGNAPANAHTYSDTWHSGLSPETAYDFRVIAANATGESDPAEVGNITTLPLPAPDAPLETRLLIHFDGTLNGTSYTLGQGEVDQTGTFKASGAPVLNNGEARINAGNQHLGSDGFAINPLGLGNLTTQNWIAEVLVTYYSTPTVPATTPIVMDLQGNCNMRLRDSSSPNVLQLFYWNGASDQKQLTPLPPNGERVHLALAWDASTTTLTGYVNGVPFGSASSGPFVITSPTNLSFGFTGRADLSSRWGIDGILDAVAFRSGNATFNPATGFLILPQGETFASWISGFPVGELDGFHEDADGDGLKNGVEALLGTDPSVASGGAVTQVSTTGTVTTFTHPMASEVPTDVTGTYEWSPNLENWYAGDGVDGPVGGQTVNIPAVVPVGGIATVTATSSNPVSRLFIRIVAEN